MSTYTAVCMCVCARLQVALMCQLTRHFSWSMLIEYCCSKHWPACIRTHIHIHVPCTVLVTKCAPEEEVQLQRNGQHSRAAFKCSKKRRYSASTWQSQRISTACSFKLLCVCCVNLLFHLLGVISLGALSRQRNHPHMK